MKTSQNFSCNDSILICIFEPDLSHLNNVHRIEVCQLSLPGNILPTVSFWWLSVFLEKEELFDRKNLRQVCWDLSVFCKVTSPKTFGIEHRFIFTRRGAEKHSRLAHLQVDKHLHPSAFILGDIWAQDSRSKILCGWKNITRRSACEKLFAEDVILQGFSVHFDQIILDMWSCNPAIRDM